MPISTVRDKPKRTSQLAIRFTKGEYESIRLAASKVNLSASDFIRLALRWYMEANDDEQHH